MASPTAPIAGQGLQQGDLQTVVAALQALTVQLGSFISHLDTNSTNLVDEINTSINDLVAVTNDLVAATSGQAVLPPPNQYFHTGAASTLVHTGPTILFAVLLNTANTSGTGTLTTVAIHDGTTSGSALVASITYDTIPQNYDYGAGGIALTTGLFVVAAGTPCDITLVWKAGP